jgi:NAD(P)-dependent dehydrogenase (short-subunit alcohol dehydrogenase family)
MQIGVNHFGHFYLTYLLWDKIKQSPNPRIINLSSMAHMSPSKSYDIDFSNLHYQNGGYNSFAAYSQSKKANILFTK